MTTHQQFLQLAINLAVENVARGGGPFAAVIVKNQQVLATGCNRVTASHDPTAHAEISAIRNACQQLQHFELEDCTLYSSCEPCPMCLGAVYWSRLAAVYYADTRFDATAAGFDDSFIYTELERPITERRITLQHLPIKTSGLPFTAWVQLTDKIPY
jgi:guanine deaminase